MTIGSRVAVWSAAMLAALGSCRSATGSCESGAGVAGRWTYSATQESPVRATLNGTMLIPAYQCADFQGVIDVVETLATGESRRLGGTVSGFVIAGNGTMVQFEATLNGASREHLARLAGDSLSGSWVESLPGGAPGAGAGPFSGRRQAPQ